MELAANPAWANLLIFTAAAALVLCVYAGGMFLLFQMRGGGA